MKFDIFVDMVDNKIKLQSSESRLWWAKKDDWQYQKCYILSHAFIIIQIYGTGDYQVWVLLRKSILLVKRLKTIPTDILK